MPKILKLRNKMTTQQAHIASRALPAMSTVRFKRSKCAIDLAYEHSFEDKSLEDRLFGWLWAYHPNPCNKALSVKHNIPSGDHSAKRGKLSAADHGTRPPNPAYTSRAVQGFRIPDGTQDNPVVIIDDNDEALTTDNEAKLAPFGIISPLRFSQHQMGKHDRKCCIVVPTRMDWSRPRQPQKREPPISAPESQSIGTYPEEAGDMREWTLAMLCEARKAEMKNSSEAFRLDIKRILSMTPLYSEEREVQS